MIRSILDTDLYKLTIQQMILEKFPNAFATYEFKSRRSTPVNKNFLDLFTKKLVQMDSLRCSDDEIEYLRSLNLFSPAYLQYLKNFKFNSKNVEITVSSLDLKDIAIKPKGFWRDEVLWEVPVLALISECYYETVDTNWSMDGQEEKFNDKGRRLTNNDCSFSEFGTRRRRSFDVQDLAVKELKKFSSFAGTSNVLLAKNYGVNAVGTIAHEVFMGISGLVSLNRANKFTMQYWHDVYKGKLNIMLPDTFGTDAFIRDFDLNFARTYDVRQDSGSPIEFADKFIKHYSSLGINPMHKKIVFSDGLDVDKAIDIRKYCSGKIGSGFGIGTHLTNDFENSPALNIVMKLQNIAENEFETPTEVVKLSDVPTKATGNSEVVRIARKIFFNTPLDQKV